MAARVESMKNAVAIIILALFTAGCASTGRGARTPAYDEPLLAVTPAVAEYSIATVSPLLEPNTGRDTLTQLLRVSNILTDPTNGIGIHRIDPVRYMVYDKLSNVGLGFLSTAGLSPAQRDVLRRWHGGTCRTTLPTYSLHHPLMRSSSRERPSGAPTMRGRSWQSSRQWD